MEKKKKHRTVEKLVYCSLKVILYNLIKLMIRPVWLRINLIFWLYIFFRKWKFVAKNQFRLNIIMMYFYEYTWQYYKSLMYNWLINSNILIESYDISSMHELDLKHYFLNLFFKWEIFLSIVFNLLLWPNQGVNRNWWYPTDRI